MPLAFRASAQAFQTSSPTSLTIPASVQTGDLLILHVAGGYGPTAVPSGWTQDYFNNTMGNVRGLVAYKVATGTDAGSSVNITWQSSWYTTLNLIAISGGTTFRTTSHLHAGSGGSAAMTPEFLAAGDMVVYLGMNRQGGGAPTISRGTTDQSGAGPSNITGGIIGYELLGADGPVGASFTSPSGGIGYLYSQMVISGGGTPSTSFALVSSDYVEVATAGMGGVAVGTNYTEVAYVTTPQMQVDSVYTEALAGGSPSLQVESAYLEVLAPSYPPQSKKGWGVVK